MQIAVEMKVHYLIQSVYSRSSATKVHRCCGEYHGDAFHDMIFFKKLKEPGKGRAFPTYHYLFGNDEDDETLFVTPSSQGNINPIMTSNKQQKTK